MSERHDGRNGKIWRGYAIFGKTQEALAEEFGISQERVSHILNEVRQSLPPADTEQMRRESLEFLTEVKARSWELAEMTGAPVAVGKDGNVLYDPVTNEVVRDYTLRLRALDMAAKIDAQVAKRFGLDAPERHEVQAKINYEIVDVAGDDLT